MPSSSNENRHCYTHSHHSYYCQDWSLVKTGPSPRLVLGHTQNTSMVLTALVTLPDEDVHSDSSITSNMERPLVPERGQNTPPQSRHASLDSLVAAWFQQLEMNCSEQAKRVLLNSRKSSTCKTDAQKWKRFSTWLQAKLSSAISAPLPLVLKYLLQLKTSRFC